MKHLLALVLLLAACKGFIPSTGPSPAPPPPVVDTPAPSPVNPGPSFSYDSARGVLLFAGTQGTEGEVRSLISRVNFLWPNKQLIFNTCSETAMWEETPWADGPPALGKENLENLQRFLTTTAEMGTMVRLNIFCTVRDNHRWMDIHWEEYTIKVAEIAKEFDHVLLSIGNEPHHRNSWFKHSISRIREVRDVSRMAGFRGPMGADDNLECAECSYTYAYTSLGFTPDFHPFRYPSDPGPGAFRKLVEINGLPLVISEPTAYSEEWRDDRCCTGDRERIIRYFHRAEREGITMFYHSTRFGLEWPQQTGGWIPIL